MKKTEKDKQQQVLNLLEKQRIRDVKELDSYKLSVCHPHSAGIDLGSRDIYVALSPAIAAEMGLEIVHRFGTFTSDLQRCCALLQHCGITTVSMESTSVYWTTIYSLLQSCGMEVCLVNPKKFRMVPGRKTDILDCQWLQTLHLYGLLRGSFHPSEQVDQLRSYMREREKVICEKARFVQRMQKALTKMNLLLYNVLEDITGKTGILIIEAILRGERDPRVLASFRDGRVKKSEEEIAHALTGYYKEDQLYLLRSNYQSYQFFELQLRDIDLQIESQLKKFPLKKRTREKCPDNQKKRSYGRKNGLKTQDNLKDTLYQILGADLTALPGMGENTILQIISEVGTDMSKFPSAKHFASYLGFVPHQKITGGQVLSSRTDRIKSSAAQAFKKVIPSISRTNTALGSFYRRLAPRIGKGAAIVATSRKLAILFYNTLMYGGQYTEYGQTHYQKQLETIERKKLLKLAAKYQMQLVPE